GGDNVSHRRLRSQRSNCRHGGRGKAQTVGTIGTIGAVGTRVALVPLVTLRTLLTRVTRVALVALRALLALGARRQLYVRQTLLVLVQGVGSDRRPAFLSIRPNSRHISHVLLLHESSTPGNVSSPWTVTSPGNVPWRDIPPRK